VSLRSDKRQKFDLISACKLGVKKICLDMNKKYFRHARLAKWEFLIRY
jgi:hypothetical protein